MSTFHGLEMAKQALLHNSQHYIRLVIISLMQIQKGIRDSE